MPFAKAMAVAEFSVAIHFPPAIPPALRSGRDGPGRVPPHRLRHAGPGGHPRPAPPRAAARAGRDSPKPHQRRPGGGASTTPPPPSFPPGYGGGTPSASCTPLSPRSRRWPRRWQTAAHGPWRRLWRALQRPLPEGRREGPGVEGRHLWSAILNRASISTNHEPEGFHELLGVHFFSLI